jgi:hypothetical protein
MEKNGEAIMHDIINKGGEDGEGDYTQAEPEQHTYDIGDEPLFPNSGISKKEVLTATALVASLASSFADAKRISQGTASYTPAEDRVLYQAWIEITNDPICNAEQNGFNYWRKVGKFFHEQRKLCEKPFQSDPYPRNGAQSMPSVASVKGRSRRSKKGKLVFFRLLRWSNLYLPCQCILLMH